VGKDPSTFISNGSDVFFHWCLHSFQLGFQGKYAFQGQEINEVTEARRNRAEHQQMTQHMCHQKGSTIA
jgi:hypothetical protein